MQPENLTPDQRDEWEERAAIMEFCGGLDRETAERVAWECVKAKENQNVA